MWESGQQQEAEEKRERVAKPGCEEISFGIRNMFWREEKAYMNTEVEKMRAEVF